MNEKSEKLQALEGQQSSEGSTLAVLRSFVEHPGWAMYSKLLAEQQEGRKGEILFRPLASDNAVFTQEFMKGEVSGLALAQVAPFAQIETLQAKLKVINEQLERENELEKRLSDDAGRSRVDSGEWHSE